MKLLDLFCGAGGAGYGYHLAGFDVVGVDIEPMPNYPFTFVQGDALEYLRLHGDRYDVIHASPPCQAYSEATPITTKGKHPKLIKPVRELLLSLGKPYVIENVEGSRSELVNPVMLCGSMFGLKVWRHRYFEIYPLWAMSPASCRHVGHPVTINPPKNARKNQGKRDFEKEKLAMEISWMNPAEISQAIPPAYTKYIGGLLLANTALLSNTACTDRGQPSRLQVII